MEAIETLKNEHRLIERVTDALVAFAEGVEGNQADGREELGRFVTVIRDFADGCHHGKEEEILFATMIEGGFPRDGGPIAVMLMEHDEGRSHASTLAELAGQPDPWGTDDRDRLVETARGYADLLREHIHKEDEILYPMAEQRLAPHLLDRVAADCQAFQAQKTGSGEYGRLQQLAEELVARHAPAQSGDRVGTNLQHGCY